MKVTISTKEKALREQGPLGTANSIQQANHTQSSFGWQSAMALNMSRLAASHRAKADDLAMRIPQSAQEQKDAAVRKFCQRWRHALACSQTAAFWRAQEARA